MNEILVRLILKYVETAEYLFPKVAFYLSVKLPISDSEWAVLKVENPGVTLEGIEYKKHGVGIIMKWQGQSIDLDFGPNGEFNGFDPWRLEYFANSNNMEFPFNSSKDLELEIQLLLERGILIRKGSQFFISSGNL